MGTTSVCSRKSSASHLNITSRSWCPYTQITSLKQGGFDSHYGKPRSPFLMLIIFLAPGSFVEFPCGSYQDIPNP